jgi:phage virion morphogenesis protein
MINISASISGDALVFKNLNAIKSPKLRKRIINQAAKQLIKSAKARTVKQVDINGNPFGDYSRKTQHTRPRRRKMLTRIVKRLAAINITADEGEVGFKNSFESSLAAKHQFGFTQNVNKRSLAKEKNSNPEGRDAPASRTQAKALLEAGYKVKRAGKALWTPSIKYITQNMTIAQAGLILRVLRGDSKDSWQTTLPARPFLGVTAEDIKAVAEMYKQEVAKALAQVAA